MRRALLSLLQNLELLADHHPELGGTAVRDRLRLVIDDGFADPQPGGFHLPLSYAMSNSEADAQVRALFRTFFADTTVDALIHAPLTSRERMGWFQDAHVRTQKGSTYETFFGHVDRTITGGWRRRSEAVPALAAHAASSH